MGYAMVGEEGHEILGHVFPPIVRAKLDNGMARFVFEG